MDKADLTIRQVKEPETRWCSSGHVAPVTFKIDGADGKEEPTRFFRITGKNISGIYCEPCLCLANYIASKKREGK